MEQYFTISLVLILPVLTIFILRHFLKTTPKIKLPPGPKPWPIIGNIHLLGFNPHRSVAELSKSYGPLMSLRLGMITTIVVSSPEAAKEVFSKYDLACSSRQIPDAGRIVDHHKFSIVWLPVCPKWRDLRKILTIQLFTNQRLDANQGLRKEKVDELVRFVNGCSEKGLAVDIGKAGLTTSLNLLSNTFFSMDFSGYDSSVSEEFKDLAWCLLDECAKPNVSDLFPLLRPLDLQGIKRKQTLYFYKMLGFFEKIIDERLRDETAAKDDVLATLLKLVEENELSLDDVKHMLADLFIAGNDTASITLEWSMMHLLSHPEKMAKAQAEIDQVLDSQYQSRPLQESDISKLPYVQAIVKEIWRMYPPVPFLVPRKAEKDVQLYDYHVPKNAQVWVNVWSIGRDPSIWPNPESFEPERHLDSDIDVKGHHFELIPFGAGRRMCPGMPLGHRK